MNKGINIFSLKHKTALITGATGYLGSAMAFILAEAGAKVLVNSRVKEKCNALATSLLDLGYAAEPAAFDVNNEEQIKHFFNSYGGRELHILINNAYAGAAGSIENANISDYVSSYDVSVLGAHRLLIHALPYLRAAVKTSGDASVINIASMYGMVSPDFKIYSSSKKANPPFYGAAKAALLQWSKYAACEFGKEGIRFNSISPGPFPADNVQKNDPELIQKLAAKVPLGRVGMSEELKGPTLFLASSASSFVNGSNLVVDGGWTSW